MSDGSQASLRYLGDFRHQGAEHTYERDIYLHSAKVYQADFAIGKRIAIVQGIHCTQ